MTSSLLEVENLGIHIQTEETKPLILYYGVHIRFPWLL